MGFQLRKKFSTYTITIFSINITGCIVYLFLYFFVVKPTNWIDILTPIASVIACVTNLCCIVLLAKKRVENFYFGIIAVIFFIFTSAITTNYGSVILNFYYLIMNSISINIWKKNMSPKSDEVKPISIKRKTFILILIGSIIASIGITFILTIDPVLNFFGNKDYNKTNPVFWLKHSLNSIALVISIVAMLFATFYIRQQWIMWFISNVSTISLWLVNVIEFTESQNLSMLLVSSFTLYTYCFSFVNSIFGYRNWRKNEAKSQNIVNLN